MSIAVSDILTYSRQLAQTDSNDLTDAAGLIYTNDALQNFTRELIKRGVDAAQIQESYTSIVGNQGTYSWPSDMFMLKTIEINYTDTQQNNYLQATKMDVSNIQVNSFDWLRLNQPTNSPLFDNHGDTFEIFPTPLGSITNGIKIFYFLQPTEYSSVSSTLSYPQTLDYRCLSCRVISLYYKTKEKFDMADKFEEEYQIRLNDIIKILAPESQQPITPQPLQISGWQF